jgi:hypothetical protein
MKYRYSLSAGLAGMLFAGLAFSPLIFGWGDDGHQAIARVAVQRLPADMPEFFRSAGPRLAFLSPEPDRWNDNLEYLSALRAAGSPDHFIDIDSPETFQSLPDDRYTYSEWLRAKGQTPHLVGFLPYAIVETYQKVQVSFRMWRDPQRTRDREQIEQSLLYSAGLLGHYVGDGANPLHTTPHYNGWTSSWNPDLFTREPIHSRFESEYIRANIQAEDFSGQVKTAEKVPDVFHAVIRYLLDSHAQVPQLYRLEKAARWEANNRRPESRQFVAARLASASQMLTNLWYSAYLGSTNVRPAARRPQE